MLVVLTETCYNKVNIQITQRDDFIQNLLFMFFRDTFKSVCMSILGICIKKEVWWIGHK